MNKQHARLVTLTILVCFSQNIHTYPVQQTVLLLVHVVAVVYMKANQRQEFRLNLYFS